MTASVEGCTWQEVRLSYRPPYDVAALFAYLAGHAIRGIEELTEGRYRRSLDVFPARGVMELEALPNVPMLVLRLQLEETRGRDTAVERCRHLLDLDRDAGAIASVLERDSLLAPLLAKRPGLRVAGAIDGFELAVRAVLGQQVSVAGACTLLGRVVDRLGEPVRIRCGAVTHHFPTPQALEEGDLSGLGITGARIVALQSLAGAVVRGELDLRHGVNTATTSGVLQSLPGIGPWTAQYIAMRALGDGDACPIGDLGLRRALQLQGLPDDPKSVAARAEWWRPWRAYAVHHLWATLPSQRRTA